jgi:uroporphyrinogen-III decarboxylase
MNMLRRSFLFGAAASVTRAAALSRKERVDRALDGHDVDRPPFSFWHHFGLKTAEDHARATLDFHHRYRTDIVKVMSDFPYPRPAGKWFELKVESNPFPAQIRALELIKTGLDGQTYFVETLFNPFNVAEKLSSPEEVRRLKSEKPQALLDALDVITQSEIHHARQAIESGAAGILLAVANANETAMSRDDYVRFSAPFDRRILDAVRAARLNILHLHTDRNQLPVFRDFPAPVINYSLHVTGIPISDVRRDFSMAIMGGIDEVNYRKLQKAEIEAQWKSAAAAAGPKFLLSPGCSVPNDSAPAELQRLPAVIGA